ncbi:hypothetical protein ACP275_11G083800 [Erythranthe tilingii]
MGRVVSSKEISSHSIKANATRLLQLVIGCKFQPMVTNKFVITFNHRLDLKHAMEGCLWLLDKNALLFRDLNPREDANLVEVNKMTIIVRFHHVPTKKRSVEMITQIANRTETFVEVLNEKKSLSLHS